MIEWVRVRPDDEADDGENIALREVLLDDAQWEQRCIDAHLETQQLLRENGASAICCDRAAKKLNEALVKARSMQHVSAAVIERKATGAAVH